MESLPSAAPQPAAQPATGPATGPAAGPDQAFPLFYRAPEPLSAVRHGGWRLQSGDFTFAEATPYVPLTAAEFAAASRCCPIVFAAGDDSPVAVLGLERRNLFVENGLWAEGTYVPAYVRRYPFAFMATAEPEQFVLAIDADAVAVVQTGEAGEALFDNGAPTDVTRQALGFCEAFRQEVAATQAFTAALIEKNLLVDRRADATLPDGRTFGLTGLRVVDSERFNALDLETLGHWHAKGWLALVYFHLASLERFSVLVDRQSRRAGAPETAQ